MPCCAEPGLYPCDLTLVCWRPRFGSFRRVSVHFTFTRLLEAKEFASLRCQQVRRVCCNQRQEVSLPKISNLSKIPKHRVSECKRFEKLSHGVLKNSRKCRKHKKRTFLTNKLGSPHYALNVAKPVLSLWMQQVMARSHVLFNLTVLLSVWFWNSVLVLAPHPFARFPDPDSASKIFQNGSQVKDFGRLCSAVGQSVGHVIL